MSPSAARSWRVTRWGSAAMAAITMDDFLNGCSQFRTTLSHASHKVVREWDPEALKNAFGWADYIEQVSRAQRREPPASLLTHLAVRRR